MDYYTDYTGRKLLAKTLPWLIAITLGWCIVVMVLWSRADHIYTIDLTNHTQMRKFLSRTTRTNTKPFKHQTERAYFDLQCNARLEKMKKKDAYYYRNASAILLGQHESLPNVYACLLTVVSDIEAKGLCESDNKEFVRNDTSETHRIFCRYRRSDHESTADNEKRTY